MDTRSSETEAEKLKPNVVGDWGKIQLHCNLDVLNNLGCLVCSIYICTILV